MIWVIGSKGMLGAELCHQLAATGHEYVGTDLDVDILDKSALKSFAAPKPEIHVIVNCAAYTAVDKAEDEPDLANAINAQGAKNIADIASEWGVILIHISTDYVFPGSKDVELNEDDPTGPLSAYGSSKLSGEELVKLSTEKKVIIRTAWLYGLHGKNFVFTMLELMKNGRRITVVDDQHGAPTNAADLAETIISILDYKDPTFGVFHYSGSGRTTWYGFACEILKNALKCGLLEKGCEVVPIATADFPTKATRPKYSLLDTSKIQRVYDIAVPAWEMSLEKMISNLEKSDVFSQE